MGELCTIGCENSTIANEDNIGCQQHPDCIIVDGVSRPVLVVNRQLPGPSIQVSYPDCIIIDGVSRPVLVVNRQLPGPSIQVSCPDYIITDGVS